MAKAPDYRKNVLDVINKHAGLRTPPVRRARRPPTVRAPGAPLLVNAWRIPRWIIRSVCRLPWRKPVKRHIARRVQEFDRSPRSKYGCVR